MHRTTDHGAYFTARDRSAALPPVGPHAELVRDLEARLAIASCPAKRACIALLLGSARRAVRLPAPPRVPTLATYAEIARAEGLVDLGAEHDHRPRTESATVRPGVAA
ncbi:hypothetical protein [Sandaracinus amylolyticus]|uniref:Uncharacterized protein n=1 Tax=Sandaracinus amylolyticus TaxID=927083 RepID=A0A0F6W2Y5_9BACT|nr:hypothetical protein [Sandaracinus amylolyticus]AKF06055.1 hypothetical protein DB32_003204 [Sandaracinus amylolyticus]